MIWLFILAQAASKGPNEIEDIRPPVTGPPSAMIVVVLAVLLLLTIAAYYLWPSSKKMLAPGPMPKDVARDRLKLIRDRMQFLNEYQFSVELSDVLRGFIEQHFGIKAIRQTTDEFLNQISEGGRFDEGQRERLLRFLETCDKIKFARSSADAEECKRLYDHAVGFVEEAK
ncbi:MAG: hypothetical protein JO076_08395 [Verrucomicrobia bacterium]|nr:hypothetical protein [Verrucomicrobiota bacterium]